MSPLAAALEQSRCPPVFRRHRPPQKPAQVPPGSGQQTHGHADPDVEQGDRPDPCRRGRFEPERAERHPQKPVPSSARARGKTQPRAAVRAPKIEHVDHEGPHGNTCRGGLDEPVQSQRHRAPRAAAPSITRANVKAWPVRRT